MTTTLHGDTLVAPAWTSLPREITAVLRDGAAVVLRPLGDGETTPQLAVLEGMSDASRRQRFLVPIPARPPAAVTTALGAVDGRRHVAWLALVEEMPVGVGRAVEVEPGTAELAFEVVDAYHRRGIGTLLLEAVTLVAAAHGVRRLTATTLSDNVASVRLLTQAGLRLRSGSGLLEGTAPLRLPCPARLDMAAVLSAAGV